MSKPEKRRFVLVIGDPEDEHCRVVEDGLRAFGIELIFLNFSDWFGSKIRIHLEFPRSGADRFKLSINGMVLDETEIGFVWVRRIHALSSPPGVDGESAEIVLRSTQSHIEGFLDIVTRTAPSTIAFDKLRQAENKIHQQHLASEFAALKPLPTVISNKREECEAFVRRERALIKALRHSVWREGNAVRTFVPRQIGPSAFSAEDNQSLPAIYQRHVRGKRDVRAVLIDSSVFGYSIQRERSVIDWKDGGVNGLTASPIDLPQSVEMACVAFAARLEARLGVFDFVIDEDGLFRFLEFNPNGQFLFLEPARDGHLLLAICGMIRTCMELPHARV